MSAIGTTGIMGANVIGTDEETFQRARAEIDGYLAANFEPTSFVERRTLTPCRKALSPPVVRYKSPPGCRPDPASPIRIRCPDWS